MSSSAAAATSRYGKGLMGLLKKQWDEQPQIVITNLVTVVGLLIGAGDIYYLQNYSKPNPYSEHYIVYRHDDPRVAELRTDF